jgi:hypothetical protein
MAADCSSAQPDIALYKKIGFVTTGQKREEVAGEMVDFQTMELQAKDFKPVAIFQDT